MVTTPVMGAAAKAAAAASVSANAARRRSRRGREGMYWDTKQEYVTWIGREVGAGELRAERIHLCEHASSFGFEGFALAEVVVLRVFAGTEFEVEIA